MAGSSTNTPVSAGVAAAAAAKISYALPAVAYGLWALVHRGHRPVWVVVGTLPVIVLIVAALWGNARALIGG